MNKIKFLLSIVSAALLTLSSLAFANENAAKKWVNDEFQPSTISKGKQMKEMKWFINASKPFKGMEINVYQKVFLLTHMNQKL